MPEIQSDKAVSGPEMRIEDAVTGLLYDMATDPVGADALVDDWEQLLATLRSNAPLSTLSILDDESMRAHASRANTIMNRLSSAPDAFDDTLACYRHIQAVVVGPQLQILAANDTAMDSYGTGTLPDVLPVHPDERQRFLDSVTLVLAARGQRTKTLKVRAMRTGRIMLLHFRCAGPNQVVVASTEVGWPKGFDDTLKTVFELTTSEVAVIRGLLEYGTLGEIAATRSRSIGTIRNQMKSIQSKTDTRSQVELVRLVMSLMDVDTAVQGIAQLEPDPQAPGLVGLDRRILQRSNGRQVEYYVYGDRSGRPVLYCHGDVAYIRLSQGAEREMEQRGIKLITPVYPGYGVTSWIEGEESAEQAYLSDMRAVADAEGADRFPVLSFSNHSIYAVRFAQSLPSRVTSLFLVSGLLPYTRPAQLDRMDRWQRLLVTSARYTPQFTPLFVKAAFAIARRLGPRKFLNQILLGSSEPDLSLLNDREISPAMLASAPLVLRKNGTAEKAFTQKLIDCNVQEWADDLRTCAARIPVHAWAGGHDPLTPLATLLEFQADYEGLQFRIFENDGFFLNYARWSDMLDHLDGLLPD